MSGNILRIVQYLNIKPADDNGVVSNQVFRFQNYFINENRPYKMLGQDPPGGDQTYSFAPFRAEGTSSNLGGDNSPVSILLPYNQVAIKFVEQFNGNRLSRAGLATVWLSANDQATPQQWVEYYVGIGASYSDDTLELRFRSATDSVGSQFPSRKLTRTLVGILPLNADLRLQ